MEVLEGGEREKRRASWGAAMREEEQPGRADRRVGSAFSHWRKLPSRSPRSLHCSEAHWTPSLGGESTGRR